MYSLSWMHSHHIFTSNRILKWLFVGCINPAKHFSPVVVHQCQAIGCFVWPKAACFYIFFMSSTRWDWQASLSVVNTVKPPCSCSECYCLCIEGHIWRYFKSLCKHSSATYYIHSEEWTFTIKKNLERKWLHVNVSCGRATWKAACDHIIMHI